MSPVDAKEFVKFLQNQEDAMDGEDGDWLDPCHIATTEFREVAIKKLNRDSDVFGIALVELFLTEALPDIEEFCGIFAVDEIGIWYYDGDGDIDDPIWRQRVIPWRYIKNLVLYALS